MPSRLICPECGGEAVKRPPREKVPWRAYGLKRPRYSHADGTSLCPVVGRGGYQPAEPRRSRK